MLTQSYPHLPAGHTTEWLITPHFAESTAGGEAGGQLRVESLRGEWSGGCKGTFQAVRDTGTKASAAATAAAAAASRRLLGGVRRAVRNADEGTVLMWLRRAAWVRSLEGDAEGCLLYTSPSPRDKRQSRMPSSA